MGTQRNNLLIFHHFNQHQGLSSYVCDALERLNPLFRRIIFVSNSLLTEGMTGQLSSYCHQIIQRENKGYDFGGWRDALSAVGWDELQKFDSLTLMNDTCFGPLFDMKPVFDQMEDAGVDFWGITRHPKRKKGMPGTDGLVPDHIQSYFMTFGHNVIASSVFHKFWQQVQDYPDVNQVIQKCETKLTNVLAHEGFKYEAFLNLRMNEIHYNERAIFTDPDVVLKYGSPLVKIKSFLYFESPPCLVKMISKKTDYDISLIEEHVTNVYNPNVSINISKKSVFLSKEHGRKGRSGLSTALHFHVFYVDIFEKQIMQLFHNKSSPVDLFITTDTEEKKLQIKTFAIEHGIQNYIKEIILVENRGRDVLPWLKVAPMMKNYDVAGHFHTKKSLENKEWVGDAWMNEVVDVLLKNLDEILWLLYDNQNVGMIIPDIPVLYKNIRGIDLWNESRAEFAYLWDKMKLKKYIDPLQILSPVMPYGNMFWYRPDALEPLYTLDISAEDFPPEPIPPHGTIAHVFESLPVYVAWAQGYDFRVLINPDFPFSGFNFTPLVKFLEEKQQLLRSPTWRVGRIVSYLPGRAYRFVQKLLSRQ